MTVAHEHPVFAPLQWLKEAQGRPLVKAVFEAIESAVSIDSDFSLHN
jgi:hypothetical protein